MEASIKIVRLSNPQQEVGLWVTTLWWGLCPFMRASHHVVTHPCVCMSRPLRWHLPERTDPLWLQLSSPPHVEALEQSQTSASSHHCPHQLQKCILRWWPPLHPPRNASWGWGQPLGLVAHHLQGIPRGKNACVRDKREQWQIAQLVNHSSAGMTGIFDLPDTRNNSHGIWPSRLYLFPIWTIL